MLDSRAGRAGVASGPAAVGSRLRWVGRGSFCALTMLEPEQRKRALWLGVLGVFGATVWLFAVGKLLGLLSHPRERVQFVLVMILLLVGLALAIVGVWQLTVARDRRWDRQGLLALLFILIPGIPILGMLLFLVVVGLSPPGRMFGD
jgi:uncharacterized membrane protein YhaH (DUF805 family)